MAQILQDIGHITLMLLLLMCSAFFSGSETAFFNLSRRQIKTLKESKHRISHLLAKVLNQPNQLLGSLLLGNLIVNILFFSIASVLAVRVEREVGVMPAAIIAFIAFAVLVLFGEILPKSLSYANSKSISLISALPAFFVMRLFTPIVSFFRVLIVDPVLQLILGPARRHRAVTPEEFKSLIEATRKRGLITAHENRILAEVVEFGFLKAYHVMRPRVDMIACSISNAPQIARDMMVKNHLTELPVYDGAIDNIVGFVELRDLLLRPKTSLDKIIQPVHFVPEQKKVESLLEFFRRTHSDTAIAVDEYGGVAGLVCLEDIAEEILGPIQLTDEIAPIEQIGPARYRLTGNLAIHDWARRFGLSPAETQVATVGGLVTGLLGKIPEAGDTASLQNLRFTVEQVRRHRIQTVLLTIEPLLDND